MTQVFAEPLASRSEERWFLARLALMFMSAIGVFALLLTMRSQTAHSEFPRVQLQDGTWLVARAVTVGMSHSIEIPYPMEEQITRWKRSHTEGYKSSKNRMVVWLTHENDRGEMLDFNWFGRCELVLADDPPVGPDQYQRQQMQSNGTSGSGTGSSGFSDAKPFGASAAMTLALIRFELPLARPREGKMRLDVYDGTKQVVAQLSLPYPALPISPPDDWRPDALPASRTDGNLQVTLKSMKYFRYPQNNGISTSPQLEFAHDGQVSSTWSASHEFLDPLGNVGRAWNCDLSPHEPAWKLQLTMYQNTNGRFLPEETKKLPGKPMPEAKKVVFGLETHTVNGVPILVRGVGGPGPLDFTVPGTSTKVTSTRYQPGNMSWGMSSSCSGSACQIELSTGHPFLMTDDKLGGPDSSVQVIIRDQSGEELKQQSRSGASGLTFWFFETKTTTTSLEVELIVQKFRRAEFLIAPPQAGDIQIVK